ncbi:MAG: hypothetical protein QXU40_01170 [Candidatus Pacearchaeota archaeon]
MVIKRKMRGFDILGNIALLKFPKNTSQKEKKSFALKILKRHKSVKTALEKIDKFKGRLRKQKTKWIAGEKTKEVIYKENGCIFRFNIDKTYFSPRLSGERKEIAGKIKEGNIVFVMFAGVGPYSIIIAKNSKAKIVYSNEINRDANRYAKINVELNKVKDKIIFLNGDIKKVVNKNLKELKNKFDVIVMPRPNLKENFLKEAFILAKKNARVFYYDFSREEDVNKIIEEIRKEAKKFKRRIRILNTKRAGEISPHKYRIRIDFQVL